MGRLRRFLMLEHAREGDGAAGEARAGAPSERVEARFSAVDLRETGGAADAASGAGDAAAPAVADRFAPAPEPSLLIDVDEADGERPSTRCLECGAENGRFAATCAGCGASLRSRAVVRLNRRLWQEERRQVASGREARRSAQAAELEAMAEARRAQGAAEVEAAFARFVSEERARRSMRPIERAAAALAIGPLARWSSVSRLMLILGAFVVAQALLGRAPGTGARVLQLGLGVLLVAACLRPRAR